MKYPNVNLFAAWFFLTQLVMGGWVAGAGNLLLEVLGVQTQEGFIPGRMVGALLLMFVIYLVWYFKRVLPPQGKPEGNGYTIGHRVVFAANILACLLYVFRFFEPAITDYNTHLVLDQFTTSFGYFAMGCFAVGFSLIYQSSLPQEQDKKG
jgi:hypothetical protein